MQPSSVNVALSTAQIASMTPLSLAHLLTEVRRTTPPDKQRPFIIRIWERIDATLERLWQDSVLSSISKVATVHSSIVLSNPPTSIDDPLPAIQRRIDDPTLALSASTRGTLKTLGALCRLPESPYLSQCHAALESFDAMIAHRLALQDTLLITLCDDFPISPAHSPSTSNSPPTSGTVH